MLSLTLDNILGLVSLLFLLYCANPAFFAAILNKSIIIIIILQLKLKFFS